MVVWAMPDKSDELCRNATPKCATLAGLTLFRGNTMALKIYAAALAATSLLTLAGAASAASIGDAFTDICLPAKTVADATARARSAGFVTAPPEIRAKARGFPDNGEILWRTAEGEMLLFISASVKRDLGNSSSQAMTGDVCAVASIPPQPDLSAEAERRLNVGPVQPVGKSTGFVFEQTEGGRVRLDVSDKALMGVKVVQGSVRVVGVLERASLNGLMMMTPSIGDK
jgi:hypothetical protein